MCKGEKEIAETEGGDLFLINKSFLDYITNILQKYKKL